MGQNEHIQHLKYYPILFTYNFNHWNQTRIWNENKQFTKSSCFRFNDATGTHLYHFFISKSLLFIMPSAWYGPRAACAKANGAVQWLVHWCGLYTVQFAGNVSLPDLQSKLATIKSRKKSVVSEITSFNIIFHRPKCSERTFLPISRKLCGTSLNFLPQRNAIRFLLANPFGLDLGSSGRQNGLDDLYDYMYIVFPSKQKILTTPDGIKLRMRFANLVRPNVKLTFRVFSHRCTWGPCHANLGIFPQKFEEKRHRNQLYPGHKVQCHQSGFGATIFTKGSELRQNSSVSNVPATPQASGTIGFLQVLTYDKNSIYPPPRMPSWGG